MPDIIPSDSRTAFLTALRSFADFLESNPTAPIGGLNWQGAPAHVNPAVEVFASEQGLTPVYDDEGNASVVLRFGPIEYRVYGYADFDEHCERNNEKRARTWAEEQGLEIVAPQTSLPPQPPAPHPVDPNSKAACLARLIAEKYPKDATTELVDGETLTVFVTPAGLGDWEWWLGRFHIPTGTTTHRGSYSTAKGNHGSVQVLLTGHGVPALYAAQAAGGAL